MSNYSCLTCGAPRAEVARFKTEREYRLVTQLAGHQAAPKTPLEGRHKVWLVVGAIFMLLGIIRFGLAVSGIDVPVLGSLFLALIPFLIGFVICCIALQRAHRIGW
jgi:hypothetical protein